MPLWLICMLLRPCLLGPRLARAAHHHPAVHHHAHHLAAASAGNQTAAMGLSYPPEIVQEARGSHTASVIMLHGLGDTGHGWSDYGPVLQAKLPFIKFIFPSAPARRVTLNMGMMMPAWFDIRSLEELKGVEDLEGLRESQRYVEALVQREVDAGIPSTRIVVMGFSQGGAVALLLLKSRFRFAGLVGLSTCLPSFEGVLGEANRQTSILIGHGTADQVPYPWGQQTVEALKGAGARVEFATYAGMGHSSSPQELQDIQAFLARHLPPSE